MRFRDNFGFELEMDENARLDEVKIPPLILQPYVENAIGHGLKLKKNGPAMLKIRVFEAAGFLNIIVEDNGIGRAAAAELKKNSPTTHQSKGLKLTEEIIRFYKESERMASTIETIDLFDSAGRAAGTRVVFRIKTQKMDA